MHNWPAVRSIWFSGGSLSTQPSSSAFARMRRITPSDLTRQSWSTGEAQRTQPIRADSPPDRDLGIRVHHSKSVLAVAEDVQLKWNGGKRSVGGGKMEHRFDGSDGFSRISGGESVRIRRIRLIRVPFGHDLNGYERSSRDRPGRKGGCVHTRPRCHYGCATGIPAVCLSRPEYRSRIA